MDDIGIAKAIARTVRTVPGVSDINPGRFAVVATYGPHDRVPGVALRRTVEGALIVDVHVSLDANAIMQPSAASSARAAGIQRPEAQDAPVLLTLADQIRHAINDIIQTLDLPRPERIDVAIDDLA